MAEVHIQSLNKKFDEVHAVKDVNLGIRDKEFVVLVGPSGCGKTTLISIVAGLLRPTEGDIEVLGQVVGVAMRLDQGKRRRNRT